MACLAASLLLVIGAVRLWPTPGEASIEEIVYAGEEAPVSLKQVTATRQSKAPPPPPPLPPVEVPDRIELEQQELDFSNASLSLDFPSEGPSAPRGTADASTSAEAPDMAARQISIVEPKYTEAARDENIRARVVVEVLVGKDGRVKGAEIIERLLLDEAGNPVKQVSHLGYGLEAAALAAARRTIFLPARSGGQPVKSRKRITIRFGL